MTFTVAVYGQQHTKHANSKSASEDSIKTPDVNDFVMVEVEPRFDYNALRSRIVYPDTCRKNDIEGKVLVAVLIGVDGKQEKLQVLESVDINLDHAAMRAIQESEFAPALQNGKPVKTWVRIPVQFSLGPRKK